MPAALQPPGALGATQAGVVDTASDLRTALDDDGPRAPGATDKLGTGSMVEIYSGFELPAMYEAGEAKRPDHTDLICEDQVDQLRADYGDRATLKFLNFESAVLLAKPDVPVTPKDRL